MPKPKLTSVDFPNRLHKRKGHADLAVITEDVGGGKVIAIDDEVLVVGTKGKKKKTIWNGTITKDNHDGTWNCDNLTVLTEEQNVRDEKGFYGPEDVSTTVTNGSGTSDPVTTTVVMIP